MTGRPAKYPFLEHDGVLAFAHRGGADGWPENTMVAFEGAARLGYRYIETDVHCTRDGVLVAFHDDVLDRVTDGKGRIADLDYATVKAARVDGREPIPLMEELLGALPDMKINIDPKLDNAVEPLVDVIKRTGSIDRVCIGSFSGARLTRIRKMLGPALCTSMGPLDVTRLRAASYGLPVGGFAVGCAQVPVTSHGLTVVDRRFVRAAHRRELQVHVWTIDDPDEMNRLLDLGVDGLMTDRPAVLKQVLQDRGLWA